MKNACHGSDSPPNAEREIEIIFPHILHDEDEAVNRPGTAESAMVNGHSVPIRETKSIFEGFTFLSVPPNCLVQFWPKLMFKQKLWEFK